MDTKGYLFLQLGTGLGLGFIANGRFETKLPYAHMGGSYDYCNYPVSYVTVGNKDALNHWFRQQGLSIRQFVQDGKRKTLEWLLLLNLYLKAEQEGNLLAIQIISEFLGYLKTGIDNYINIYAPEIIVIGGGVSKGMKPYLEPAKEKFNLFPLPITRLKLNYQNLMRNSADTWQCSIT